MIYSKNFLKIICLLLMVAMVAIQSCSDNGDNVPVEPEEEQPAIKEELKDFSSIKTDDWRSKIGTEVSVEGYLIPVAQRIFKLVNDSSYARLNAVLRDENYILVQVPMESPQFDYDALSQFNGAKVKIAGKLDDFKPRDADGESMLLSKDLLGAKSLATVTLMDLPIETGKKRFEIATKNFDDDVDIVHIKPFPANRTKFALLYSGGVNAAQAYAYYYNNIRIMYQLLIKQGYVPENIVVVYKEGKPDVLVPMTLPPYFKSYPEIPVNYSATPAGLDDAIAYLKAKMKGANAELFIMTTNHGGGYHRVEKKDYSGYADSNKDEPLADSEKLDEIISYYNSNVSLTDDEFAKKVNSLPFVALKALFLQCFSGGLIYDLKGPNRVLMSATTEYEYSWGGGSMDMDVFFGNIITPIFLYRAGDITFGIDANKDGQLTMNEIFQYARILQQADGNKRPQYKQSPQYDDDGDGLPNEPTAAGFGGKMTL